MLKTRFSALWTDECLLKQAFYRLSVQNVKPTNSARLQARLSVLASELHAYHLA